jgi:ribosomal protein S18 acetylase RimI-like enzyme
VKLPIVVRNATAGDVAAMQAVDVAARQRFREIAEARIARSADDPPYGFEGLTRAATEQRAWVALDDLGAVIGFAVACVTDGEGHLDELAVTPAHGRRGIGRALVDEVLDWSAARGLPSVTLITFRHVPWNGPFYEKLGFKDLTALTPALQAALDQSANWGVPRDVVMRRPLVDADRVERPQVRKRALKLRQCANVPGAADHRRDRRARWLHSVAWGYAAMIAFLWSLLVFAPASASVTWAERIEFGGAATVLLGVIAWAKAVNGRS